MKFILQNISWKFENKISSAQERYNCKTDVFSQANCFRKAGFMKKTDPAKFEM